jgi:large subunit ribosomal protein L10
MLISIRGISTNKTNTIRAGLREKNIHITIIRNSLAKKAFEGTNLESLSPLLTGASALAYGAESVVDVARELVDLLKKYPDIELKGAVLDGQLFTGEDGVKALSKFPTKDEAIGQAVTLVLSPGRKLVAAIKGPGSKLVGIVKTIEEKLEKGETISKL